MNIKPKLKSRISSVVLAFYIALSALGLNAEPIPSPPKVREWKETYPGGIINYSDKSVDYSRDGKVVFRTIERTSTVSRTGHSSILIDHLIEFAAEGKTFASIVLDISRPPIWEVTTAFPVHISAAPAMYMPDPKAYSFTVCVPKLNYYEYLEVIGGEIKLKKETQEDYEQVKRTSIKYYEKGYIEPAAENK